MYKTNLPRFFYVFLQLISYHRPISCPME